jgi:uncharacterized protein (DUF2147 family)
MILFLTLAAALAQTTAAGIEGHWTNPSGSVTILIAPCGDAFCGTVTAASDKAKADSLKHGTKQLVGTELLTNFAPNAKGRWTGKLFVPDVPIHAKAKLEQTAADELKVTGCSPTGVICKSQVWTRSAG